MLLSRLMKESVAQLAQAGVETADIDVQLLLGHCLGMNRSQLFLAHDEQIPPADIDRFNHLLARRVQREPLAYIIGSQEFWSLEFLVAPAVLIPRPETEFMLEKVLAKKTQWQSDDCSVLDLCTGSGAIAIVLAKELHKNVDAVDISPEALAIARHNAFRLGVLDSVTFYHSDLLSQLPEKKEYGLIVSNPPYVRLSSIENELEPEVADHEPRLALDGGGEDGLDIIRRMRDSLPDKMTVGGEVFIEFGAEQGRDMVAIFATTGADGSSFSDVHVFQDYAGRDRVLHATLYSK